jgi:hypothetical protein
MWEKTVTCSEKKDRRELLLAGVTVLGVGAVLGSIADAKANQPYMQAALNSLQNARWNLQHAEHDKGGHRANALNLVNQAIDEVQTGIAVGGY